MKFFPWRPGDPDPEPDEPPTLTIMPGGSLIDPTWLANERARGAAFEKSLKAQAASREDDYRASLAELEQAEQARRQMIRAQLPEHLRGLVP
jgi:hypothetical protein